MDGLIYSRGMAYLEYIWKLTANHPQSLSYDARTGFRAVPILTQLQSIFIGIGPVGEGYMATHFDLGGHGRVHSMHRYFFTNYYNLIPKNLIIIIGAQIRN